MNNGEVTIKITDVIGGKLCIASDDGDKVYQEIARALKAGKKIKLSFEGVNDLTSAFLNAAVGQLYKGEIPLEQISESIKPVGASSDDLHLLKRVVDRAKEFFKDPERFKTAARKVLGGDDA